MDDSRSPFGERLRRLRIAAGLIPGGAGGAVRAERAGDRRAGDGQTATAVSPHRGGPGRCAGAHREPAGGAGRGAGDLIRGTECAAASAASACATRRPGGGRAGHRRAAACRRGPVADVDRSWWRRQDQPGACGRGRRWPMRSRVMLRSSLSPRSPRPRSSRPRSRRRWVSHTTGQQSPDEVVRTTLRSRRLLLVLDNLEHLPEAALWVADLLAACPGVTVLATSRSALRLQDEREVVVGSAGVARGRRGFRSGRDLGRSGRPSLHRAGRGALVCVDSGQRRRGGDHLPPPGRAAAGHRAGCCPGQGAFASRIADPTRPDVAAAHRRASGSLGTPAEHG